MKTYKKKKVAKSAPISTGTTLKNWRVESNIFNREKLTPRLNCVCLICNSIKLVAWNQLASGKTSMCRDCSNKQKSRDRIISNWGGHYPNELELSLSERWYQITQRCGNPKDRAYKDYGGRGIKLDEAFRDKKVFVKYCMKLSGADIKKSLDRIDNNRNYEPGNIRWATEKQQSRNTRLSSYIQYKGEQLSSMDFTEKYCCKFHPSWVKKLIGRGLTGAQILERETHSWDAGRKGRPVPKLA